ncbi:hypothetical protein [uncultured Nocardioides sp.]|nr:hypothetical protein [uncultured Nocardioides sp.]
MWSELTHVQRARQIAIAETTYAGAIEPYEVVEPVEVLLKQTREV